MSSLLNPLPLDIEESIVEDLRESLRERLEVNERSHPLRHVLTQLERSVINDFLFVCRVLPDRRPIITDLQQLIARYAASIQ
jgi:hypothetical protein